MLIKVQCRDCGREGEIELPRLGRRLRCSACGAMQVYGARRSRLAANDDHRSRRGAPSIEKPPHPGRRDTDAPHQAMDGKLNDDCPWLKISILPHVSKNLH